MTQTSVILRYMHQINQFPYLPADFKLESINTERDRQKSDNKEVTRTPSIILVNLDEYHTPY